jgi:hypothetical protein
VSNQEDEESDLEQEESVDEDYEPWPRDVEIDSTKEKLLQFFDENTDRVYYDQQLRVLFEERPYKVYQWITGKALTELREEGKLKSILLEIGTGKEIAQELISLPGAPTVIRFFWHPRTRFWRHTSKQILKLVRQFSTTDFAYGLGHQGELLADLALMGAGFKIGGKKVRSWKGKTWSGSKHDLDRVYERDRISYGCEIKNTLGYIPKDELAIKMEICGHLDLRPLVIARSLPPHYVNLLHKAGGLGWIIGKQAWPFAQESLAEQVRRQLGYRISCAPAIEDGAVERFLKAHHALVERSKRRKKRSKTM